VHTDIVWVARQIQFWMLGRNTYLRTGALREQNRTPLKRRDYGVPDIRQ